MMTGLGGPRPRRVTTPLYPIRSGRSQRAFGVRSGAGAPRHVLLGPAGAAEPPPRPPPRRPGSRGPEIGHVDENIEDELERLNAEVSLLSHELEKRRGEPSALGGMDAPDLKLLESELEDTLKRVRAAQLSAVTQQRQACSICMVNNGNEVAFQCGHQTCKPCSTQIDHCAVCRCKITLRIDLFGG